MAEVGVLDLQIHDNSAKAAAGLGRLASALERVRSAVGSGKQLSGVSNDLEKINNAVAGASGGKAAKSIGDLGKKVNDAKQATSSFVAVSSKIEETMSDVGGTVSAATEDVKTYTSAIKEAQKATESVGKTSKKSWKSFNPETGGFEPDPSIKGVKDVYARVLKANEDAARVNAIRDRIADMRYGLENPEPMKYGEFLKQSMNIEGPVKDAKESMDVFLQAFENMDSMTETEAEIAKLNPELQDLATNGKSSRTVVQRLKDTFFGADNEIHSFGDAVKGMLPSLSAMGKQMESIARRMALRAIIKQVTAGFKEGVQNLYEYSNAVGTSFAPAMDSAASTMLQFKNSIGAAAAPVIQALIPVLQTVVDWFITAINYANQFLSLITGKGGWTKAIPTAASAFEDASKKAKGAGGSAKKAAKEVKELLADWDELNIIQSDSGAGGSGGGGGGGAGAGLGDEFSSMFEEIRGFDKEIKAFVKNLKDEFGSVLGFVTEIGAAVLAWKASAAFTGLVADLLGLTGAGIALDLVFKLVNAFDKTYAQTGSVGWLVGDVLTTLIGATFVKKILDNVLKGKLGWIGIPLTLAVSAGATIKAMVEETDLSALNERTVIQSVLAALKGGAAIGMIASHVGKLTTLASVGAGLAGTLITFGAAIGIKATSVVASTGEITKETILADVTSAVATTLGVTGLALALGASAPVTIAAGVGALVFTAAATIGLQLLIAKKPVGIEWGDKSWTEQEVKNFVEGSVFKVSPKTILDLMDPKIQAVSTSEEGLMATAEEVKLSVGKVLLGFDDTETLKSLENQILGSGEDDSNSLIGKLRTTMKAKQSVIETGLTIQFTDFGTGKTDTGKEAQEQFKTVAAGWDVIDQEISSLGRQLSASFGRAYKEGITEEAKAAEIKTIAELSQMIANVSAAMTRGETIAQAQINLKDKLSGITGESFGDIVSYIEEYKNEVTSAYTVAYDAVIKELGSQAAGVKQSWENELWLAEHAATESERNEHARNAKAYEDQYKATYALYKSKLDGRDQAIKDAAGRAIDSDVMDTIRETIAGNIQGKAGFESIGGDLERAMYDAFNKDNKTTEEKTSAVTGLLDQMIGTYFGSDAETIKTLVKNGILSYKDVIDQSVIESMGTNVWDENKGIWQTIIDQVFGTGTEPIKAEPTDVELPVSVQPEIEEATSEAPAAEEILGGLSTEAETNLTETDSVITEHTFPDTSPIDSSATTGSLRQMLDEVVSYVNDIIATLNMLNGLSGGFSFSGGGRLLGGAGGVTMQTKAMGGNIRSGEMFFGNENGRIEMMGKMGNSAVVANNQQIVEGISRGVAASNSGMENAMNMMVALMRQFVSKEFTAKVVPSSSMGRNNAMSSEMYRKVTG